MFLMLQCFITKTLVGSAIILAVLVCKNAARTAGSSLKDAQAAIDSL